MSFDFTTLGYYYWFLPLTVLLSLYFSSRRIDRQLGTLLLMSYVFFILATGWHLLLLITSTLVDWTAGKNIHNSNDDKVRKRWLISSLAVNLGLLGIFKYLDFGIRALGWWSLSLGGPGFDEVGLLLPVGISFYTFQTMSYTIDIYRRKEEPAKNFVSFACYAAFFPQLVAGPIVRYPHFRDQVSKPLVFSWPRVRLGLTLIAYGLVKKFVFADNFAVQVNSIFTTGQPLDNPILVYWGTLLFGLQIYCDFSAYTDIALGSAQLFGIQLPENFRSPYLARTPQEFWRRWHISLSTWLRDYLYISLGGNRHGVIRMYLALMATMVLGGLWHGASWNFVLWGFLHGTILMIHRMCSGTGVISAARENFPRALTLVSWAITQWLVFLTWLVFRIEENDMLLRSMKSYILIDSNINFQEAFEAMPGMNTYVGILLVVFIILHLLSGTVNGSLKYHINRLPDWAWGIFIGASLAAIYILKPSEIVEFIYFRF
jgi:D-alanyl-lipoteichoic acid acyltransferase DltB (MBOAT superfamily)